jgi:hypothetical protein
MECIKSITNQTAKKLEVTLIIRKGDDPQNTWGYKNHYSGTRPIARCRSP